ncbi:clostripain-related cysteine peptidase [Niabella beijingensis]|uniref:clostripain-related cysteine peptidase n=1 Tax=Niabella beijingensis TaxID=2872700 RepID=UPI001CBCF4AC|nr:clostripain-related cysteine peptidase [Niabella beijingensis]MBZ4188243.1 clostripain [Niabella beijingensis]
MRTHFFKYFRSLVLGLLFFSNCKKERGRDTNEAMVLIYMAANNDLRQDAIDCLNRIESGFSGNNNLLVYIKTTSESSCILKIKHDNTNRIMSDTILQYGSENSSDPQFMKRVIGDARKMSPALEYGLILWSHASSWAPPLGIKVKSFGEDRGVDMDIIEMKNTLPLDFSYIIFDACSMASVEAIYELRNNAKYILASPTEVLSTSYPYEQIIPYLFGGKDELKKVAQRFMSYYRSMKGDYASATVSLIDTEELDLLAQKTKSLLDAKEAKGDFNVNNIQRLDFDTKTRVPAYDFLNFLEQNFNIEDYSSITNQLRKTILFKDNTSGFLGNPINSFSGLSIYLPRVNDIYQNYYSKLAWYQSGGCYNLFSQ